MPQGKKTPLSKSRTASAKGGKLVAALTTKRGRVDLQWDRLTKELEAKTKARDKIDPFGKGWDFSEERIEAWRKLNDAVEEVRDRMSKFIADRAT
jgi:hypothetical protein